MKEKIDKAIPVVLGFILIIFGVNKFALFMPILPIDKEAESFINCLLETGYMMLIVGAIEIVVGLMLVVNRYVPLALLLLAPIVVNILLFHLVLDIKGIVPGLLVFISMVYLMYLNKEKYLGLLQA